MVPNLEKGEMYDRKVAVILCVRIIATCHVSAQMGRGLKEVRDRIWGISIDWKRDLRRRQGPDSSGSE
jgi:hypothetical protein